ncbi:PREDICTED: uncharacterized protein LOC105136144, partial [Populus euphratica]|uniref:Uncharacterized protein LOC105136144 n=1 Tax=Populus euphratica TaxID=75702 RepID=A0AAJ6Y274_POPEU
INRHSFVGLSSKCAPCQSKVSESCHGRESVVAMPTFVVQLETQDASGTIVHRFNPIGKILKPVLVECVSPVTCSWSLFLLLREAELMLVFEELRPPVKMLIPICKALCDASGIKEGLDTWKDADYREETHLEVSRVPFTEKQALRDNVYLILLTRKKNYH